LLKLKRVMIHHYPKILLFTTLSMWEGSPPRTFEFFYFLFLFSNGGLPWHIDKMMKSCIFGWLWIITQLKIGHSVTLLSKLMCHMCLIWHASIHVNPWLQCHVITNHSWKKIMLLWDCSFDSQIWCLFKFHALYWLVFVGLLFCFVLFLFLFLFYFIFINDLVLADVTLH